MSCVTNFKRHSASSAGAHLLFQRRTVVTERLGQRSALRKALVLLTQAAHLRVLPGGLAPQLLHLCHLRSGRP